MGTFHDFCFMEWFLRAKWNHRPGACICYCLHSRDTGAHVYLGQPSLSEYKFDMAKTKNKVGRPPKKARGGVRTQKPDPKVRRNRNGFATKNKAIVLHQGGMSLKDIRQWFLDNEKVEIKTSTICTWYNRKNVSKLKDVGDLGASNNDTCINPSQRPCIIVDVEQILNIHVKRSQENGLPLTLQAASIAAIQLYE